ncbi:TRAP transporter small permease [uncultured Thiothrix sp.]|jgi:TRAP-type C4-dicarboxylate transport system permease small subunit|uniref:TRAP transporter small permease n=1 Tax=uncultured Thiothrix sp. TaxID=223185 RepID=UPI002627A563|nr:TRAP transporter small permease [uncultured Thiothrix sp.]HMT92481.1 TRAP transporter small permease [Thiolinea sp.]
MTSAEQITQHSEKGLARWLALALNLIAGSALLAMMVITCIDVIGRYLFNKPLVGGVELIEVLLGVMIFMALPVISWRNEQVVVDILDPFIPPHVNFIRTILFNLLTAIALVVIGQRIWDLGARASSHGEVTEYLHLPVGAIVSSFGVMCWFTALVLVTLGIYRALIQYRLVRTTTSANLE